MRVLTENYMDSTMAGKATTMGTIQQSISYSDSTSGKGDARPRQSFASVKTRRTHEHNRQLILASIGRYYGINALSASNVGTVSVNFLLSLPVLHRVKVRRSNIGHRLSLTASYDGTRSSLQHYNK